MYTMYYLTAHSCSSNPVLVFHLVLQRCVNIVWAYLLVASISAEKMSAPKNNSAKKNITNTVFSVLGPSPKICHSIFIVEPTVQTRCKLVEVVIRLKIRADEQRKKLNLNKVSNWCQKSEG